MDKLREFSDIFYHSMDVFFAKSPPGYSCLDLHYIHDFHQRDYLNYLVKLLYSMTFSESGDRVYNKLYFYCFDDVFFDLLQPFVRRVNEKLRGNTSEFIMLDKVTANTEDIISRVNQQASGAATIIFETEKLVTDDCLFRKRFNDFAFVENQLATISLLNAVKMIDSEYVGKGYIACHSRLAPVVNCVELTTFVNEVDRLSVFDFYNGGAIHQNILSALNVSKKCLNRNDVSGAKIAIESCCDIQDADFVFLQLFSEYNNRNNKIYSFHLHEMLKKLDIDSDFSIQSGISVVKICLGAESYPAARKILNKIAPDLNTQDELELGIQLADESGCNDISAELLAKLEENYPESIFLNIKNIKLAIKREDYQHAATLFSLQEDELSRKKQHLLMAFIAWLDNGAEDIFYFLNSQNSEDIDTVFFLNYIVQKWTLKRRDYSAAIAILQLYETLLGNDRMVQNSDKILNEWLFNSKNPTTDEEKKLSKVSELAIVSLVKMTFERLFDISINPYVRERFVGTMGWNNSHSKGLSLLIYLTHTQFCQRALSVAPSVTDKVESLPVKEVMARIERCQEYYAEIGIVIAGKHQVPDGILTGTRSERLAFLKGLRFIVTGMARDMESGNDIQIINMMISIAHSAAFLAGSCHQDIDIIKDVGAVLTQQGYAQEARDLAEQALQMAGDDPLRQRHAWLAAAEIYQRQNNNHTAMVYLNCAMSASEMTLEEFFTYSNLVIRIFRDTKFLRFAHEAVNLSRVLLKNLNHDFFMKNEKAYDFLQLTLCFNQLRNDEVFNADEANNITRLAINIALKEIAAQNDFTPILTLSMQLSDFMKINNHSIDPQLSVLIDKMLLLNDAMSTPDKWLRTFSGLYRDNNINHLFELYQLTSSTTRYAEDRAYDDRSLHVYAAILLRRSPEMPLQDLAFCAELLTDSSYSLYGDYLDSNPYPRYTSTEQPAEYAAAYARENNVAVYMLILDDDQKGILLRWLPGMEGERVDPSLWCFDFAAFNHWKKEYPYQYGFYDAATKPNLFFESSDFMQFHFDFSCNSILIFDVLLQSLVPGLIPLESGFAATKVPLSCAPSLAWLAQSTRSPLKSNGKLVSWISTAGSEGQTLKAMADEFCQEDGVFTQWNVVHNGDSALPAGFENSELVIIGAHGGVTDSERIFSSVSDEGDLRVNFTTFSSRLRQCGVVILFVCSSGRFDNHPESATTIGLAKELLDHGCAAVISSPWPLDPMMTMKWLPLFMQSWMTGATVSEAVFEANRTLTAYYSYDYSKCVALNVFGDGTRRYKKNEAI